MTTPPKKGKGSGKPAPNKKAAQEASRDRGIADKVAQLTTMPWELWKETTGAIDELCDYVIAGNHLHGFAKARGFGYTSMRRWIKADADRAAMYADARVERTHMLVDEMIELADNVPGIPVEVGTNEDGTPKFENIVTKEAIAQQKMRIEARQWYASRLNKQYSEKHTVESTVTDKRDLSDEALLARMKALGVEGVSLTPEPPAA